MTFFVFAWPRERSCKRFPRCEVKPLFCARPTGAIPVIGEESHETQELRMGVGTCVNRDGDSQRPHGERFAARCSERSRSATAADAEYSCRFGCTSATDAVAARERSRCTTTANAECSCRSGRTSSSHAEPFERSRCTSSADAECSRRFGRASSTDAESLERSGRTSASDARGLVRILRFHIARHSRGEMQPTFFSCFPC